MNIALLVFVGIICVIGLTVGFLWFFIERPYQRNLQRIGQFHDAWERAYKDPNSNKDELIRVLFKILEYQKERAAEFNRRSQI